MTSLPFSQPELLDISHVISYDFLYKIMTEDMECSLLFVLL